MHLSLLESHDIYLPLHFPIFLDQNFQFPYMSFYRACAHFFIQ
jgi:hypothetical protein